MSAHTKNNLFDGIYETTLFCFQIKKKIYEIKIELLYFKIEIKNSFCIFATSANIEKLINEYNLGKFYLHYYLKVMIRNNASLAYSLR